MKFKESVGVLALHLEWMCDGLVATIIVKGRC